ncbi:MAG TPA: zf-HC2 domain-containing protein [Thermoanaerobaculia bacterium]|nr:zf-HC2 domain-containing protein [Thermoanaerobaculia bacterium]
MSGDSRQHPGRSADFLSRLHDGELDPGERAHFEAHRAHCAECRRAALEFEDALSLFRSARSRPPQADLAGRILRKIQTSPRPRAPFGRRFRTDLGWAALLLTGIFALLLSVQTPQTPVVVSFPTPAPETAPPAQAEPGVAEPLEDEDSDSRNRNSHVAPAAPKPDAPARDSAPVRPVAEGTGAAPPATALEKETATSAEPDRAEPRPALAAESGRAGGAAAATESSTASPLRLSIEAIDGHGSPPPLLSEARLALPASYRGHEFILHVDSQGKVSEVRPGPSRERREETGRLAAPAPAPAALSELEFKPGNRPRRLLVRFE